MTKPARGRPRSFDPDKALDAAIDVFLVHGFDAASLDHLTAGLGINRPSLYAAFGDKEKLYQAALEKYAQRAAHVLLSALGGSRSLGAGLQNMFSQARLLYAPPGKTNRGCLIASTAVTRSPHNPEIQEFLASFFATADSALAEVLVSKGLPRSRSVALAQLINAGVHSLALRVRSGATETELDAFVAALVRQFTKLAGDSKP